MCIYLLKMREYYRWEKGLPYGAHLPREEVGAWLAEREAMWEHLGGEDYQPLEIEGRRTIEGGAATAPVASRAKRGESHAEGSSRRITVPRGSAIGRPKTRPPRSASPWSRRPLKSA